MNDPPYRIVTERLVVRCWEPRDAPLLKEAVDSSLDDLRPWMPWAYDEPQTVADEAGSSLQRVVEPVVRAQLRPLRGEPVSLQVDERDLEPRLVEPTPGIDTSAPAQNSSSFRTASTTRSTEGM